jgi:hypothetical protein
MVGALAVAVSVQGSERVSGERGKAKGSSGSTRLVTGPSANLNDAVAAGATATIDMQPVRPKTNPATEYAAGTTCAGVLCDGLTGTMADCCPATAANNEIVLTGPSRVWAEVQITGWGGNLTCHGGLNNGQTCATDADCPGDDGIPPAEQPLESPACSPQRLKTLQAKLDSAGFMGSVADCAGGPGGTDLSHVFHSCANNTDCRNNISGLTAACGVGEPSRCAAREAWMPPGGNVCQNGFQDQCDPEWASSGLGTVPGCATATPNYSCGFAMIPPDLAQDFFPSYAATFVIEALPGAKGTYTVGFVAPETFMKDDNTPVAQPIPLAALNPMLVTIPCGSCCFGVGGLNPGCTDSLSEAECNALAPVAIFNPGGQCVNPPTDEGCCECLGPGDCNDGDLCTQDVCTSCVCSNPAVATWDPATECCNAADGSQDTLGCADQCEAASCTLPGSRGDAQCLPRTGESCDDDNPCTYADTCADGAGSCAGADANLVACVDSAECAAVTGVGYPCIDGFCNCTLTPDLTVEIIDLGGDDNCFASGEKVTACVHVAASSAPVNGGQVLLSYDPSCLDYNSTINGPDYPQTVYGPVVDEGAGSIFVAVGVEFGTGDGPNGNADIVCFSFDKIGECDSCVICPLSNNPQNTYLTDNEGQRITVAPSCSKNIYDESILTLDTPGNIKTNVDCDRPTAVETWAAPSADDSCGNATVHCRGEHESGMQYDEATAMGGGEFPLGASSFCCYAESDGPCGQVVGCPPNTSCADADDNGKPDGCWTVRVNDETSLDITVGLSPEGGKVPPGTTRCIKFTLYSNCVQDPLQWCDDVTFGGMFDFLGKSSGKIKVPGSGQWDCITAQDKHHTLRACDFPSCVDGQLVAEFSGDPRLGGNWLIGGNLDGWKKCDPNSAPSLDVIDILDFGTFVAQYGAAYGSGDDVCTGSAKPECCPDSANADINGDGVVDMDDYAFVSANFLVSSKECCCGPQTAGANAVTEISVAQLRASGNADLSVADLNGDGVLNLADMASFDQGIRPNTKGTKGGRSAGSR